MLWYYEATTSMTPKRAAAYIGGASLMAAWLSSAAGVVWQEADAPVDQPRPVQTAGTETIAADVQAQAIRSRVNTSKIVPVPRGPLQTRTNLFFEEQWIDVGVNPTGDEEIVDFLIAIGSGNLVVRVKELELKPDIPSHSKLAGSMKLVASFQKKSPSRTPVAAAARR